MMRIEGDQLRGGVCKSFFQAEGKKPPTRFIRNFTWQLRCENSARV